MIALVCRVRADQSTGTGKSFIGALLAKLLVEHTDEKILALSYTNHALDQTLEDILEAGVPPEQMVRLGSKSSAKTKPLRLYDQEYAHRESSGGFDRRTNARIAFDSSSNELESAAQTFKTFRVSSREILDFLPYSDNFEFSEAFVVPANDNDMQTVDKRGRTIGPLYLIDRWRHGQDAGVFKDQAEAECPKVWQMNLEARNLLYGQWTQELYEEQADTLSGNMARCSGCLDRWLECKAEGEAALIKSKRIIGCTTTGAAMYSKQIVNARPGIVLVEEAGEILESHILTALSPTTKQLIMIGDHQQLRPKANNHALTVEKGDGYDLNMSMFERLVRSGYPHVTLRNQHRMRPEISAHVRELMYPDLSDDKKVLNFPSLRGVQSNVMMVNHSHVESQDDRLTDGLDISSNMSKQNPFEADMVLKTVKYLAQQGYGTDRQAVLTPYGGQLQLLVRKLEESFDPVLNELDSYDLVRAGLLPAASAIAKGNPLRVSTIGKSFRLHSFASLANILQTTIKAKRVTSSLSASPAATVLATSGSWRRLSD